MIIDEERLQRFEAGLDPQNLQQSAVPGHIVGYGEISAIFQIGDDDELVYKRMPLFDSRAAAETYENMYREYCGLLEKAGVKLPASETRIVEIPRRPVVLYIAQQKLPGDRFCHQLLQTFDPSRSTALIEKVVTEINKIWTFNRTAAPSLQLAIDGQLSNWVHGAELLYIDTSTPLFRKNGREQQDPELLLKSAPGFLRWIIRWFFLSDVMNRYYHPRLVFTDLAANLYKEQRPDLLPQTISVINRFLDQETPPLTIDEVRKYYREDKWIWMVFLAFRRADRLIKTKMLGRRYEFILPGVIKR
ncbi:MAG: DUF6206 family protein [Thermodesulfobacteriota bacterium]